MESVIKTLNSVRTACLKLSHVTMAAMLAGLIMLTIGSWSSRSDLINTGLDALIFGTSWSVLLLASGIVLSPLERREKKKNDK